MSYLRSLVAAAGIAGATYALAACTDGAPTQPMAHDVSAAPLADRGSAHMGATTGTTPGWADGKTITFFYNKPFFCQEPPASGATTGCELGEEPTKAPRGGPIPVLYVLVPLGFTPDRGTLQCPDAGACINHPSTIDLSRVFGAGTEDALLPPHSHLIGREEGSAAANAGWWEIEVVGVTSPASWQRLVDAKSLPALRALQAANDGVTGDIPTNLYLFFGVRR